ncbi:sensor histidine kinase [Chloroflexota bacterium]
MRSLSWKFGGALLLIVVVSVGLMAYITNLSTTREFRQYVSQGSMIHVRVVEDSLSRFYTQRDSWSDVQAILGNLLRTGSDRLIVADGSGEIVGDTKGEWLGRAAQKVGLDNGTTITASGREVGEFYFLSSGAMGGMGHMGGRGGPGSSMPMLDAAEQDFLERTNRSLWLAGLIAVAVALLVGLMLTRQITRPIRALTRGASQIAKGDLGYRVKVNSKDEIGQLAQSFNAMTYSLDRSEQARQRLIADIAHELRTPLTVVEGTVNGILDGVFKPDHEHLYSIKEQTTLLARLISDLRDLSVAESGQLKLDLSPSNIVDLVRRKISQNDVIARGKNIRLKLKAAPGLHEANVDPARIEQVISNLLSNAIRHTPRQGSVTVSIETMSGGVRRQVEETSVIISVADTGEGIAPEHLPHVFDRFYRVEGSRSRSGGGRGVRSGHRQADG